MAEKKAETKKDTPKKSTSKNTQSSRETSKKTVHRKKFGFSDIVASEPAKVAHLSRTQLSDFMNFVRQQGVVGLAVGLAIGSAAGAAVKEVVNSLINPLVGFAIGGIDLPNLSWVIVKANAKGKGGLTIGWGAILSAVITLFATALVVYLFVHYAKLDRLDRPKETS